jgi:hypothetical protein
LPNFEEELHLVIKDAPKEKTPGPDGFICLIFLLCWSIIKEELMHAVQHFFSLNQQSLHLLNQAYIVLVPKTSCPKKMTEYRPISPTHSFTKILTKLLANRLAPELSHLISNNQTTFVLRNDVFMIALFMFRRSSNHCTKIK